MHFIFPKLYELYLKKNDIAEGRIVTYISMFYFFVAFAIFLPIDIYVEKKLFYNHQFAKAAVWIFMLAVCVTIIYVVNATYIRNNYLQKLTKKYRKRKFSKFLLYFIAVAIFPFLLLSAGTITVVLNGGTIWGYQMAGLLNQVK